MTDSPAGRAWFLSFRDPMKLALQILKWTAIIGGAYTLGAAYGPKTPGVKRIARAFPNSAVL